MGSELGFPQGTTAMSIDVEDWFQVENLRRAIPMDGWARCELRVERSVDRMLAALGEHGARATCFILGWVAERAPGMVRRVAEAGHEVACHGYGHELLAELGPDGFRADVTRAKALIEDATGRRVLGYRAPCLSLTDWALPVLAECGFAYDSSLYRTSVPGTRYGRLSNSPGSPVFEAAGITEVSLPTLDVAGVALPWAGGGYFRVIPYRAFRAGVRRIVADGTPYVFYIHPWELDPDQPRVAGLRASERLRHYLNLGRTEARWRRLLGDFAWTSIDSLLSEPARAAADRSGRTEAEHAYA